MAGEGNQRITQRQHHYAEHDDAFGTQHFIAEPAADGD